VQLFGELLPFIQRLRGTSGRPAWLIVDEAHYMLPHCSVWPQGFSPTWGPSSSPWISTRSARRCWRASTCW
jgi:hypothetical protein